MSRFSGQQDFTGPKGKDRKNKGVLKAYRERKRLEAEERQANTDPYADSKYYKQLQGWEKK
jgi:uncharacterized protein YciI